MSEEFQKVDRHSVVLCISVTGFGFAAFFVF